MKVSIDFCDFWPGFRKTDNFFYHLLRSRFEVELTDSPDFLLYSDPNQHAHRLQNCVRIFVGVESWLPDWKECDYALTPNYLDDPRHLRLPFYVPWGWDPQRLVKQEENPEQSLAEKTGFCSFLVSSHHPVKNRKRLELYQKLSRYKKVDSGGRFMNNIGTVIAKGSVAKIEFLRPYKFHLALENESWEGYTTEKIQDAMAARTLPIYWGNPRVAEEFNPKSFVNYADYGNDEAFIERIIELDKDDAKYLEVMRQPFFHNNQPNEFCSRDRLLTFFERIFSTPITPVARRRRRFEFNRWVLARKNRPTAR
jgi:alpha(1,3/1,4) fucosyltransferase